MQQAQIRDYKRKPLVPEVRDKEYTELETLTPEIARDIVNCVTVYHDGKIEIELALRDELEVVLSTLESMKSVC